jgi:hypothetical protein
MASSFDSSNYTAIATTRQQMMDAKNLLDSANRVFSAQETGSAKYAQALSQVKAAQAAYDAAKKKADDTYKAAKADFDKKQAAKTTQSVVKKAKSNVTVDQSDVARLQDALKRQQDLGQDTTQTQAELKAAQFKLSQDTAKSTGAVTPSVDGTGFQQVPPAGGLVPAPRDYAKELAGAAKMLYSMKDSERLQIANALKKAGYNVPTNGKYSDQLVAQYQTAIGNNQLRNTQIGLNQTLGEFLVTKAGEVASSAGTVNGKGGTSLSSVIYDPTRAAAYINNEFQSILNRDATQKELTDLTGQLIAAQKANPVKVVTDANGNQVQTGGLDATQFLDSIIKKTPAYMAKVAGKAATQLETVLSTAKANGINATQAQIDAWTNRVKNGEDPNAIATEIRNIAGLGQPDSIKKMLATGNDLGTIYSPYRQAMSQLLEIPQENIDLNDPALRMAIGPDKELSLYEYQNALRKDNRWQYTQNAKTEVANTVQKVLQDFGFMG